MLTVQKEAELTGATEDAVKVNRGAHAATRTWERAQLSALEAGGTAEVMYGSAAWLALPLGDPGRAAAVIRAAAAWREHCAELPERVICQANAEIEFGERMRREITAEVYERLAAEQADEWALIAGWAKHLATVPTLEEQERARTFAPVREPVASEGWPPVAIPGRPGWWRHLIDGRQVDLPARERLEAVA